MSTTPIIITPEKNIVGGVTHELKKEISDLIAAGHLQIQLDMRNVSMIDSLGIGVLVATRNNLRQSDGEFSIKNLSPDLTQLFGNMKIVEFLNIS